MRPDYCPIGNEPCQSLCDTPCSVTRLRCDNEWESLTNELKKLRGEIGVLVGLLKWASLVIETVDGEDVSECEALMELQNKIKYAIEGAST